MATLVYFLVFGSGCVCGVWGLLGLTAWMAWLAFQRHESDLVEFEDEDPQP